MLFNLWGEFSLSELTDIVPSSSSPRIPASTIWILSSTVRSLSARDARSSTRWRSLASTPLPGSSPRTRWALQQLADREQPARECRLAANRGSTMWPLDGAVSKGKSSQRHRRCFTLSTCIEWRIQYRKHSMMEWTMIFYFLSHKQQFQSFFGCLWRAFLSIGAH